MTGRVSRVASRLWLTPRTSRRRPCTVTTASCLSVANRGSLFCRSRTLKAVSKQGLVPSLRGTCPCFETAFYRHGLNREGPLRVPAGVAGVGASVASRSGGLLGPLLLLLVQDPGMGLVEQLTEREDIILARVVRLFPFLGLLVAPARRYAEPSAFQTIASQVEGAAGNRCFS